MHYQPVSFREKFAKFGELFQPKVVAQMNDYQFKLVRVRGDFVWHSHADTDEAFIVIDGTMTIEFRDGAVTLGPGEMYVVPRGVEHCPRSDDGASLLLIEPEGTPNTGDATTAAAEVEL